MKLNFLGRTLSPDERRIAIIGSGKLTPRGEVITKKFVKAFVKSKVTIVSEYFSELGKVVIKTCLKDGGRLVVVFGAGLDYLEKVEDKGLIDQITKQGTLTTPFSKATDHSYRNNVTLGEVVSFISDAVIVIEGKRTLGILTYVNSALDAGREVFTLKGTEVGDFLLGEGATLATKPRDVLDRVL